MPHVQVCFVPTFYFAVTYAVIVYKYQGLNLAKKTVDNAPNVLSRGEAYVIFSRVHYLQNFLIEVHFAMDKFML